MRFLGWGRIAVWAAVVTTYGLAGSRVAPAAAPNVSAGGTPVGVTLTGGKLVVGFATNPNFVQTTLDRIDQITWNGGSGLLAGQNLIPAYDSGYCNDATEFFGEADSIVIPGSAAVASLQTGTSFTSTTSNLDCNGNARGDATAATAYAVYPAGDPNENEFRVARTLNFTGQAPVFGDSYLRAYKPALSLPYFIVNYPNADGTTINSQDNSQCSSSPCEITDWNGKWFAEDDDSGNGMVVFRDPASTTPAELVILFDSESYINMTAIGLLQPSAGWSGLVTEVEWVCFYDTSTWTYSDQRMGNLPQGCAQAAADTTPDAFTFTAVTGVAPSSLQTSNSVSIGGINTPAAISIVGGTYSIAGAAFTSAAGTINHGDTVKVQGTASASFATSSSVTLTIGGVSSTFSITTAPPAPTVVGATLTGHAGGGGVLDSSGLLGLAGLALLRLPRIRKYCIVALVCGAALVGATSLHAQDANAFSGYVGIRAGMADYQFSPADLNKSLGSQASQIDSISISRRQFGGALYGGVPLYRNLMLELSYAQFGQFPLSVRTTSTDEAALAQRTVRALQPAGHGVTAGFMLPVDLTSRLRIEPRVSALFYESKQELSTSAASYEDKEHGFGVDAGVSFAMRIAKPLHLGIGVDCLHMTQACNVLLVSAQVEYRFLN